MTSTVRDRRPGAGDKSSSPVPSDAHLDLLAEFSSELERLSATQRELMKELRSDGNVDLDAEELARLRKENLELRGHLEELGRLVEATPPSDNSWAERQAEYEKLLEEKSEIIRGLHLKVQELQAQPAAPPPATPQTAAQIHDAAVERMKKDLEEERRQLKEDEAAMMEQMRTMELALAKDRADLARLRTELQRQQTEFAREVEMASRDTHLRERLMSLRRNQDQAAKKPGEESAPESAPAPPRGSSIIRRLFG
jgi:hypothetical protein